MAKKQVIKKNIPSLMIGLVVAGVLLGAMAVLVAQSFFTTRVQYCQALPFPDTNSRLLRPAA